MRTAYLTGPMSGLPEWNLHAFTAAARDLRAAGFEVLSPHEKDPGLDLRDALNWDVDAVTRSDLVVVMPGWETSASANVEVSIGLTLCKPVMRLDEALTGEARAI